MLFNSHVFVFLFLPVVLLTFYLLRFRLGRPWAAGWLVLASLLFYGWWNPAYLPLLLLSVLVNYGIGWRIMHRQAGRRAWLVLGVVFNLSLLGYFKYADFFLETANLALGRSGGLIAIALPLAISFFTFQQLAFLVDAYRGKLIWRGFLNYALFMVFFPQLIAGPIVHYAQVSGQFARLPRTVPWQGLAQGLTLFVIGLFKKVILADGVAPWANEVFAAAEIGAPLSPLDAWGGTLAYSLQLYFDFSGYSDMALGLGHMFGVRLPINFDLPYRSTSVGEFWRRWHITLGAFLRDYLYIPLGGNRFGPLRTALNLMVTMLLGGLWHGAGWTFVLWGGLHGLYLAANYGWTRTPAAVLLRGARPLGWLLTFVAVMLAWVLFRAESLGGALHLYASMFGLGAAAGSSIIGLRSLALLIAVLGLSLTLPASVRWVRRELPRPRWRPSLGLGLAVSALFVVAVQNMQRLNEFIYFNF